MLISEVMWRRLCRELGYTSHVTMEEGLAEMREDHLRQKTGGDGKH